jgi:hypothetical protein
MAGKRKQPERQSFSRVCSCTFRLFRHFRREKAGHRKAGSTRPAVLVVLLAAALFVCLFIPAGLTAHAFRTGSGQPVAAIEENAGGEQGGSDSGKKGCKSAIGVSALAVMVSVSLAGVTLLKRKKEN